MSETTGQRRRKRLDRGIKARTDTIFVIASPRDTLYLLLPRVLPVIALLVRAVDIRRAVPAVLAGLSAIGVILGLALVAWLVTARSAHERAVAQAVAADAAAQKAARAAAESASLDSVRVPEGWRAHTDYYFRRGSIFVRECARAVANHNADGYQALARKEYPGAIAAFTSGLEASWNASSFAGIVRTLMERRDYPGALARFEATRDDTLKRGSLVGLKLAYGDALMMNNDYAGARDVFRETRDLDLSPGMNEAAALRRAVVDDGGLREYLAPVVTGAMDDTTRRRACGAG